MIAIDLSKQQALAADPRSIQQINFTGNIEPTEIIKMFSILGEVKETILHLNWENIVKLYCFNIIST